MTKLSQNYLEDSSDGISEDLKREIDSVYLEKLPNLSHNNEKLVIVFSGSNAVGKSTLARKIERELKGIVLENDEVKRVIKSIRPNSDRRFLNEQTWKYTTDLYQRLPKVTNNGLVVRDGVIDWYFDRIFPIFEQNGYKLFIVGFDVSKEKNSELILTRGDTATVTTELLLSRVPEHDIHIERFRKEYTPDIILSDENLFDHEAVITMIKDRLNT